MTALPTARRLPTPISGATLLAAVLTATLLLAACGAGEASEPRAPLTDSTVFQQDTTVDASLAEVLRRRERFRVFSTMLDSARLLSTLQRGGPYTVFAPTNPGLDALPNGLVEELLLPANRDRLREVVAYHLHRGQVARDSLSGLDSLSTLTGQVLPVAPEGGRILVGNERMSEYAITTSNGRIFALDALVMPPVDGGGQALPSGSTYDSLETAPDTSLGASGSNAGSSGGSTGSASDGEN